MSTNELAPLFPSATHPALPIAAQVLSTLRNLTAPGKGNDLKPEARAALVGVAALIGCERKDLVESTAQKACSVSPAHFRTALVLSRRLLASQSANAESPSRRTRASAAPPASAASSSSMAGNGGTGADGEASTSAALPTGMPSPFSTPKKKFRYTSSNDLSGLTRSSHKHSPARPSPLGRAASAAKASGSVTPSKGTNGATDVGSAGPGIDDDGGADDGERTPTKRRVADVALPLSTPRAGLTARLSEKKRQEKAGAEAFFALRPGAGTAAAKTADAMDVDGVDDDEAAFWRVPETTAQLPARRRKRARRDWTFRETTWAPDRAGLERILHGVEPTAFEGTLSSVILARYE